MIELKDINKTYEMGELPVHALRGVSLKIEEGEFVAVMGPSGSGKSTLLHILGLLDVPDSGSYRLYEHEVANLSEDELAVLRREVVGFVFQQFNLLSRMNALENTALPLIYSKRHVDMQTAAHLLGRLGLGDRQLHRPNELSGGQQQRVAIARSLINNPRIILADEPTGNLDSASANEIINVIKKLNDEGITVVVVTHEEDIARQARRVIKMRDGEILSDKRTQGATRPQRSAPPLSASSSDGFKPFEMWHHFRQGFKTLGSNKARTGLSMLGILIGVASVVAMMALGSGAQKAIEKQLSSLGSNLLMLRSGAHRMGAAILEIGAATRLTLEDAAALRENIPAIKDVAPAVTGRGQVTYLDRNWNTQVLGVSPAYETMRASVPEMGRFFTEDENRMRSLVAVIGATVVRELFDGENPIGEMIKINKVNFRVVGVLPKKGATGFRDQDDTMVIPVLTAMHRLFGKDYIDSIDIEVADASGLDEVQKQSMDFMMSRHKVPPSQQQDAFEIRNMADIKAALTESSKTMSLLLASIAAISLLVGGIGIMNIMLVSVTERTREIGLRKAVGARRFDILSQFLAEAMVVSVIGGVAGIVLGWLVTKIMSAVSGWTTSVSLASILLAFFFSASIGIIFGLYPARKASFLNPIEALRYE